MNSKTGLLLVGFGGPRSLDEVAPMLERVMGTPPPPALRAAACKKYKLIGGASPSVPIAESIAAELRKTPLVAKHIHAIEVGMCFTEPLLEAAVTRLAEAGCERIVYLSLTAFESWVAWEGPYQRTREIAAQQGISEVLKAPVFGPHAAYLNAHAGNICKAYFGDLVQKAYQDDTTPQAVNLAFVAHSLPADDDQEMAARYEQQLLTAASLLVTGMPMPVESGTLCYVSAGARKGEWLGPSLETIISRVAIRGDDALIVCPLGFASDHMEVLYDLDIAAAQEAENQDVTFIRTPTLASKELIHPALIESLSDSIQTALQTALGEEVSSNGTQ